MKKINTLTFRTRQELASILGISTRKLYSILNAEDLKGRIPKRNRLSPYHQKIVFDKFGIPYD